MDTKLKKSSKLAKIIIALCVMVPALILVSLYPTMESAMLERRAYYEKLEEQEQANHADWVLRDNFTNYGMEAAYYLYAGMYESTAGVDMDYEVFKTYGWDTDFWEVKENSTYVATYSPAEGQEPIVKKNADAFDDSVAKLTLEFDGYGNLIEAKLDGDVEVYEYGESTYEAAERSTQQFLDNVEGYEYDTEKKLDAEKYMPKNFKLEIGVGENSDFVEAYDDMYAWGYYDRSSENLYWDIGAYWVVLFLFIVVVLVALTLPFIKGLNTGNEKIFSLSFEIMLVVALLAICGIVLMCETMPHVTMWEMENVIIEREGELLFLGSAVKAETLYGALRFASFIGWSVCFFLVYAVASNFRQFISNTKYYLKYQTISIRFLRWMKKKVVALYKYVTNVDLNDNMDKSILKIVVANFVVLTLLCCMWFFGVAALILYSIALFVILRKQSQKIQKQYKSILHATEQMAAGDLKINLEEDLGVFKSIGDSLEKVQQGFEKAVVEEAKSQNMKTELITNVSHDLKTPLTAIITYVDLLKKEDTTEEERKSYIKTLDQKSQRLKVLIEDLFEVSKAHSGNVTMNYMDVDVVSLLKQVKSEMADQMDASSLDFRWNFPEEKIVLSLDGQRTYRVFENLINNALKYAMPFTRVYVDVLQTSADVKVIFRNVSAQELNFDPERLTDRFVRGDVSRNSDGSGLGLAIAKSFVELQKGQFKIDVDGDLFKVILTWSK